MNTLASKIKEVLVNLSEKDELPLDLTQLDESVFSEILSTQNLKEEMRERGEHIDTVITMGVVDDAIDNINLFRENDLVLSDEEKEEYFDKLIDELEYDGTRMKDIISTVERYINANHEEEDEDDEY